MHLNVLRTILLASAFIAPSTLATWTSSRPPPSALTGHSKRLAVPVPRWMSSWSDPSEQKPKRMAHMRRQVACAPEPSGAFVAKRDLVTETGYIAVTDASGTFKGYVSDATVSYWGAYTLTQDKTHALHVTATVGPSKNLIADNGYAAFPDVGGVVGYASPGSDLVQGSYGYAYLGGVTPTVAGSVAIKGQGNSVSNQLSIQSSIWIFNQQTKALTTQWVNNAGAEGYCTRTPTVFIMNVSTNGIYLLADDAAFGRTFSETRYLITLSLVQ